MGENTGITWAHHTFNPWWGCVEVSDGCDFCYARVWAKRMGFDIWGKDAPRRFFGEAHWNEPLKWDRKAAAAGERRRVFAASMADIMEEREELAVWRKRLYKLVYQTPNLDWLFLTKRPQAYGRLLPAVWRHGIWPDNLWLGTTVENREALWRVDELRKHGAKVLWLSIEPMLESLTSSEPVLDLTGIHWVVLGGESSTQARSCDLQWFAGVMNRCAEYPTPPKVFVKQLGSKPYITYCVAGEGVQEQRIGITDAKGANLKEWPPPYRVQEFPR